MHGCYQVVVLATEELQRLRRDRAGQPLIEAPQASRYWDIEIEPARAPMMMPSARS